MNLFSSKTAVAALGAAILSIAAPAFAQAANIRVAVPFSFAAGDQLLRAGEYRIDVDDERRVCRIVSAADGSVSYVRVQPVTTRRTMDDAGGAMVRFAKQGDQYVLDGVWNPGAVDGNTVVRSRKFAESAKAAPVRDITARSN